VVAGWSRASGTIDPRLFGSAPCAETWEPISDWDRFTQYLQQDKPLRVIDKENQQLLYGAGGDDEIQGFANTPGILTHSVGVNDVVALDAIEESIELMRSQPGTLGAPSILITSPRSWSALRRIKDLYGRYYLSPDPTSEEANTLWGVPVMVTTQCNPGDGFLIDTDRFGKVIVREGLTVRQGLAEDDFVRNLLRWVFEERLNLAVERAEAVLMLTSLPTTMIGS
jgi:HK97 family phage major capsid protein